MRRGFGLRDVVAVLRGWWHGCLLLFVLGVVALGLPGSVTAQSGAAQAEPASAVSEKTRQQALDEYTKLPLSFVPNVGQARAGVRFDARAAGFGVAFMQTKAIFSFAEGKRGAALELRFLGASADARLEARRPLPGRVNYLLGSDRARWRTGLPTFAEVVYRDLWRGIDLVFRGGEGRLKYEFRVRPGVDPEVIRLAYRGARRLSLDGGGGLKIATPLGVLADARPVSYQQVGGRRVVVSSRYALSGEAGFGFALEGYDRSRPLVIDPGLDYSTYLGGGSGDERGQGIAVDSAGSAYVTGWTASADFPTTPGAFDPVYGGDGADSDVFVTKLNPDGSTLVYSTYLGGAASERGQGIALDSAGSAYVAGNTGSADFPTTPGAFDPIYSDSGDVFVTKLNADGSALVYSTYLGGAANEREQGIGVDAAGSAYVAGNTGSADFPTTPGAFDPTLGHGSDVFVTKLNAAGSTLVYSTYLGGKNLEEAHGIAVDSAGSAYVAGRTFSDNFPTTRGAFDRRYNGFQDVFVTKLNGTGSALIYSSFLGGVCNDEGRGIAVDSAGSAYVTGLTCSGDFPTTAGAFDPIYNGDYDVYVTKLNAAGSALIYSTYLGGSGYEEAFGIAVDSAGSAYVTGATSSADFPTTRGAFDRSHNGGFDVLVAKLDAAGSALVYSTYLGGTIEDFGWAIAVGSASRAYVTGWTYSTNFPTTTGAFDPISNGGDVFVTKLPTPCRRTAARACP